MRCTYYVCICVYIYVNVYLSLCVFLWTCGSVEIFIRRTMDSHKIVFAWGLPRCFHLPKPGILNRADSSVWIKNTASGKRGINEIFY